MIAYLSEILGVPRASIAIRHGVTGRRKIVEIAGGQEILASLGSLMVR